MLLRILFATWNNFLNVHGVDMACHKKPTDKVMKADFILEKLWFNTFRCYISLFVFAFFM